MDAVEFINEHRRMCRTYFGCTGCLACNDDGSCKFSTTVGGEADEQIALLEEWAAAHLCKTRQDVFLEAFPNVRLVDGVVDIAPCQMEPKSYSIGVGGCKYAPCVICRQEFWSQEVE